jgi:hypothetical protein
MWLATVSGPVIHRMVPSATVPARWSMRGASAASSTGTGCSLGALSVTSAFTVSPVNDAWPVRRSGSSTSRYSRMCRAGLSNE